jgi:hypothetical protein
VLPYWPLMNRSGACVGRLVLLFNDDRHATADIGRWLDEDYRPATPHQPLKRYMQRSLRDMEIQPAATVAQALDGDGSLLVWVGSVVARREAARMPAGLDTYDVIYLPRREPAFGRVAIVREDAIGDRVLCGRPRPMRWPAAATPT